MDSTTLNSEQLAAWALVTDPEILQVQAAKLPTNRIGFLIQAVNEEHSEDWQKRTLAIVRGLQDQPRLEAAGQALTPLQMLTVLLDKTSWNHSAQSKITALFTGSPYSTFTALLEIASRDHLEALSQEVSSLTIQHLLTMLSHEIDQKTQQLETSVSEYEKLIDQLTPNDVGLQDCKKLHGEFAALKNKGLQELHLVDQGLAIAWSGGRSNLIERLSHHKEHLQRFIHEAIGQPVSKQSQGSGLYLRLQHQLEPVFADLQNDLPADEALAGIGIRLDLHPAIGLKTLLDLKHAMIYSQKALDEWLKGERI